MFLNLCGSASLRDDLFWLSCFGIDGWHQIQKNSELRMNPQLKYLLFILATAMCFNLFCTEKIPEGPERAEILNVKLAIQQGRNEFAQENNWENRFKIPPKGMTLQEYEILSKWRVPFIVSVNNDFDEAIDGKKWVVIKVDIWANGPNETWQSQLIYADTTSTRHLTIPPADSLSIYTGNNLVWEQKDIKGRSIHRTNSFAPIWIDCTEFDSLFKTPFEIVPWRHCDTLILAPVDTVVAFDQPKKIFAQAEVQLFKNYHAVISDTIEFNIHYFFPADGFRPKFWCREGRVINNDPPCPFGFP